MKKLEKLGSFLNETMVEDMALTWKDIILGYKVRLVSDAICLHEGVDSKLLATIFRSAYIHTNLGLVRSSLIHSLPFYQIIDELDVYKTSTSWVVIA